MMSMPQRQTPGLVRGMRLSWHSSCILVHQGAYSVERANAAYEIEIKGKLI